MRNERKAMKNIMIIGAAVGDVLVYPASSEVFAAGSWPAREILLSTGGDGLNEATVLADLGKSPYLCTLLGKDKMGEMVRAHCEARGIRKDFLQYDQDIPTGLNVVLVQENGERSFLTNPASSLRKLKREHIPRKFPEDVGILCLASIFVSPCLENQELSEIFARAKEQGLTVCADMTKRKKGETAWDMKETFSQVDYLFANQEEGQLLTGKSAPEEIAHALLECGAGCAVIKTGGKGCYIKNKKEAFAIPGFSVECVDTTGAGDSFCAGFLYGLSEKKDLYTCGLYGNACGALAVRQVGACREKILWKDVDKIIKEQGKKNG